MVETELHCAGPVRGMTGEQYGVIMAAAGSVWGSLHQYHVLGTPHTPRITVPQRECMRPPGETAPAGSASEAMHTGIEIRAVRGRGRA